MNKNPCQIQNHNQRNIISMCFSTNCQGKRQCCPLCQNQFHNDHTHQLVDLNYLINFIKTESKKSSVLQPQISQQLQELQQVLNYFEDIFKQIKEYMQILRSMNLQQFCKDLGNKYNILKEDFQGLNNQDWNKLIDDMLSNVYVKDCAILQKNATIAHPQRMIIILNTLQELKLQIDPIEINKEYFQNFNQPKIIKGHTGIVTGIDICKTRNILATGSVDKTVRLWSLENNALIKTYEYSGEVYDVVFSNEGNLLAFGGGYGDYSIMLIDMRQKIWFLSRLFGHNCHIWRLAFSNDSKYLISGSGDSMVRVWDNKTNTEAFQLNSENQVNGIAISSDDTVIASNSQGGQIRIWDFKEKKLLCCQPAHNNGNGIEFSIDQKMLVSCGDDGLIKLWSLQELKNQNILLLIREFKTATNILWTVLFSPCSKFIISTCNKEREIKVLDQESGDVVKLFKSQSTNQYVSVDIAISKDMKIIAYGEDNNIVVWKRKIMKLY